MLVFSQYQSDLGSVFYYAPLQFVESNINGQTVEFFKYTEILPQILISIIIESDVSCEINKNVIKRKLIITAIDNNKYSCVNPIRPYTENYFTLIQQLKASDKIYNFRLMGETIKAYYLPSILQKNAQ